MSCYFQRITEKSVNEVKMRGYLNIFSFLLMPSKFCCCISWGFFNILWCDTFPGNNFSSDTFPGNNFSSSTNDFFWWPRPLVNVELMSTFTFIHTCAVSTFLPFSWIWSVFFPMFLMYFGEKNLISASCTICVHFPYLSYLSFPHFSFYLFRIISDI